MRKTAALMLALILLASLAVPAMAAQAQRVQSQAFVASDGSCQVTLMVVLSADTPSSELMFPIPANARNVTLNGGAARTRQSGSAMLVSLNGSYSGTIGFTLQDVISRNDLDQLELTLPLLSGFPYPVDYLEFRVTLPGEITAKPAFSSVYYQKSIEESLNVTVSGSEINGVSLQAFKDQEELTMKLVVTEEMFPQPITEEWTVGVGEIGGIGFGVLALLYWLLTLRCLPQRRVRCTQPPEGYTAGEIGSALIGQGVDLTMMVFSWASLGYILIHLDDSGRVVLHKRMEMGNERDPFEVKTFRSLFAKREMVDGTGYHYAQLCRRVGAKAPGMRDLYRRNSGSTRLFRLLAALAGAFGGYAIGDALAGQALLAGVVIALMMLFGGISSWLIQDTVRALHLRSREQGVIGLSLAAVWVVLGVMAGIPYIGLAIALGELLAGLMWAYGGMRSDYGRQMRAQILALRRYLRTAEQKDLQRLMRNDSGWFFTMMPYAMALGVDKAFARQFARLRLPACPYLTSGMDGHMTAAEWQQLMRRTAAALDSRQKHLFFERLFGK